ncbi:ERCC4 domain-containing protein, partial [Vibrio splendidus]
MQKNTIRLVNEKAEIVLSLHEGRVSISNSGVDHRLLTKIILATREFESQGGGTLDDLKGVLVKYGFKATPKGSKAVVDTERNRFSSAIHYASDKRSPSSLSQQSKEWLIPSAPFRAETLKSAYMRLDTREPNDVLELLEQIKIKSCIRMPLEVGDIHIGDMVSDDLLIIERKTVSDLYNSTVSSHLHDQAQRLSDYRASRVGLKTMIVWL